MAGSRLTAAAALLAACFAASASQAQDGLELGFAGTVEPLRRVEVANRVDGVIEEVLVTGGEAVDAGRLLFTIDPAMYLIALDAARAALDEAGARLELAAAAAERLVALRDRGSGTAVQAFEAERALAIARAELAARQSELNRAELDLQHTRIEAPIAGRLGRPRVSPGAFVEAEAGSALAEIVQLDPVLVAYQVPYADRQAAFEQAGTTSIAELFAGITLRLELPGGQPYTLAGTPRFESAEIDAETGTLTTWAEFPNPDGVLVPGLPVRVLSTVRSGRAGG